MKLELTSFDENHYASNIKQTDALLKWDARGHTHHLIIRAGYDCGITFTEEYKEDLEKFANEQIFSGKDIRLRDGVSFAVLPKGYTNNYQFPVSPASYAVFCCVYNPGRDICTLFVPNDACLYRCNVSALVEITMTGEALKAGLLSKIFGNTDNKKYYSVDIPYIPGYNDGGLYYCYDGCRYKYPITRGMLGKRVSIPAYGSQAPRISGSTCNGYRVNIINR